MRHLSRARRPLCALVVALAVVVIPASAQNPSSLRQVPPPDGPVVLYSTEYPRIRVVPIAGGLSHPWGMAFRQNGDILVTERDTGTLRVIRDGQLLDQPVGGEILLGPVIR